MESRDIFETVITETCEALPEHLLKKVRNVAFLVEDEPSDELRAHEGLGPGETLLGYYHGIPLTERGDTYGIGEVLPDTITIYRTPIEEMAQGNVERLEQIIRDTTRHEIAHYFGMNETEVEGWEARGRVPYAQTPGGHLFKRRTST